MSLKTDSDLLRTSVALKLKRQKPQLNENFLFEPNGSWSTAFYLLEESLREEKESEFTEEIATMANAITEQTLQAVDTEYQ